MSHSMSEDGGTGEEGFVGGAEELEAVAAEVGVECMRIMRSGPWARR